MRRRFSISIAVIAAAVITCANDAFSDVLIKGALGFGVTVYRDKDDSKGMVISTEEFKFPLKAMKTAPNGRVFVHVDGIGDVWLRSEELYFDRKTKADTDNSNNDAASRGFK